MGGIGSPRRADDAADLLFLKGRRRTNWQPYPNGWFLPVEGQAVVPPPPPGTLDVTLSWTAVSGASGYLLDIGTSVGGTQILNGFSVSGVSTTVSLASPGTYYAKVRSIVGGVTSLSGEERVVTVP